MIHLAPRCFLVGVIRLTHVALLLVYLELSLQKLPLIHLTVASRLMYHDTPGKAPGVLIENAVIMLIHVGVLVSDLSPVDSGRLSE
jgi:hypothetical protein